MFDRLPGADSTPSSNTGNLIVLATAMNVYRLGVKELYTIRYDPVLYGLILYAFTYAVYEPARSARRELADASVAFVDEDQSELSRRIITALRRPYVLAPEPLLINEIDPAMDAGRYTFVLNIPPDFQRDVVRRRSTTIQINVDATAMTQAGVGIRYIQNAIDQELGGFDRSRTGQPAVELVTRVKFNPNLYDTRLEAVIQLIYQTTMLAIFLAGAVLIREREHGTIEHLLVMPLRPFEIMLAKVWATGLVVLVAAILSLQLVVRWFLDVPIAGSVPLFVLGLVLYLFATTSLGIFLATLVRSMPQFALLGLCVYLIMNLLSGGVTPLDSMPGLLQNIVQLSPSTHFVAVAQAILFRGAGLDVVWPRFVAIASIGGILFCAALFRFRHTATESATT